MPLPDLRISLDSIISVLRSSGPRQRYEPDNRAVLLAILDQEVPIDDQIEILWRMLFDRNINGNFPTDILIGHQSNKRNRLNQIADLLLMSDRDFAAVATAD